MHLYANRSNCGTEWTRFISRKLLPTLVASINCTGTESTLSQCDSTIATEDFECGPHRDAGVVCQGKKCFFFKKISSILFYKIESPTYSNRFTVQN